MTQSTKEPQYNPCIDLEGKKGLTTLGLMSNYVWNDDPRRLTFLLSRYKFVSKMLSGCEKVLEVGCADAFGTRIVQQEVPHVVAIDFDPIFVEDANERMDEDWKFTCKVHDMLEGPVLGDFDGAYSIDVIEHIEKENELKFIGNIAKSLNHRGVLIIGSPSIHSQAYASEGSKAGHVNCKTAHELKELLKTSFHNVFIFSMNDEVVHTGFSAMAHYFFGLACNKKRVKQIIILP